MPNPDKELTVEECLVELREMWPNCTLEIVTRVSTGFYKPPERRFDIGVISTDYMFNERVDGAASLDEAMAQFRAWKEYQQWLTQPRFIHSFIRCAPI